MKMQIVLLSMAVFAVNAPKTFSGFNPSETKSVKISKTPTFEFIFFRTYQQCNGVKMAWALNSTNGVFSFTLQRTYQNPSNPNTLWEDVESFVTGDEPVLRYTDHNVARGYVSYRVIAWVYDGSSVISEVSRERIGGHHR
jgi:hypothetical protein